MNYEIVTLESKRVTGISARTSNSSPDMRAVIGSLWQRLYSPENAGKISGRVNEKSIGLYTGYANGAEGEYTVMTGFETAASSENSCETIVIPGGKYAKFTVCGNMVTAVNDFWAELWKMDIPRAFTCDFEEYQNADPENCVIHIYISLTDDCTGKPNSIIREDVCEEYAHSGIIRAGNLCFLSHCAGNVGGTAEEQINGAFDEMERRLSLFGLTLENVVQMDCLFRDVWNIPIMEKVIRERFKGKYPVRKSIQTEFAHTGGQNGLHFQADAIAVTSR